MEQFDDFLTKSPYFIKKNSYSESQEYFFEHNVSIQVAKRFDVKDLNPIWWDSYYSKIRKLEEAPEWFIQLYKQAFEEYYQKNRLRYTVNNLKLPIGNLIEIYCLGEQKHALYKQIQFFHTSEDGLVIFTKKQNEEKMEEMIHYLRSFDYVVKEKKIRNKKIQYYMN